MRTAIRTFTATAGIVAALTWTGCSNDAGDIIPQENRPDISFLAQQTRSAANTLSDLKARDFTVYGAWCAGASYTSSENFLFDNVPVSWTGQKWDYTPKKNWADGKCYRFCAYWPGSSSLHMDGSLETGVSLNGFLLNADAALTDDLLLSDMTEIATPDPITDMMPPVALSFHHALCRIMVRIRKAAESADAFQLSGVTISNVPSAGNVTLTRQEGDSNMEWSQQTRPIAYSHNTFTTATLPADGTPVSIWDEGLMLIPCNPSGATLSVRFRVTHDGKTTAQTANIPLPALPVWESGQTYRYTAVLEQDYKIIFEEPAVEPWGAEQAGGTIIIR